MHSIASRSRRMRDRITAVLAATGVATLLAGLVVMGTATTAGANGTEVWVCKYVGQPGNEVLSNGKNPIAVSSSAVVGSWFKDGQNSSFVLDVQTIANTGQGQTYTGTNTCPSTGPSITSVAFNPPTATAPGCTTVGGYSLPAQPTGVALDGTPVFNAGTLTWQFTFALTNEALYNWSTAPLTGTKTYNLVVAPATGFQSTNPNAPCYRANDTRTLNSTSSTTSVDCVTGQLTTIITDIATHQELISGVWVTQSVVQTPRDPISRPATTSELAQEGCPPGKPAALVDVSAEVSEDCDVLEITTVTTTTTTDWVFDEAANEWVLGEPEVATEADTRTATPEECPDVVAGVETERPKPKTPPVVPVVGPGEQEGGPEAVPTAVDAGLVGPVASTSTGSLLGQGLVAAGLLMLLLAGSLQAGRRGRGAHQV